jgi:hypothetical protein
LLEVVLGLPSVAVLAGDVPGQRETSVSSSSRSRCRSAAVVVGAAICWNSGINRRAAVRVVLGNAELTVVTLIGISFTFTFQAMKDRFGLKPGWRRRRSTSRLPCGVGTPGSDDG